MKAINLLRLAQVLALSAVSSVCLANIQVGGTRIVYPSTDREASIQVRNQNTTDIMIQSWLEPAAGQVSSDVPFALTPSLARLGAKKQQLLRIFYQGKGLPENQETVLWLNIQEIPQASTNENGLQIAFRQRLKVFYRPANLPGSAEEAAKSVKWHVLHESGRTRLLAANTSAFHVSLNSVRVIANMKEYEVKSEMLPPKGTNKMTIEKLPDNYQGDIKVHWEAINDYGAITKHSTTVQF
ncbi:molecular chaperone [Pseudomonas sp. NPDC086581]|uniref:fimbrial biogenesis chaperone n=1 Tax=Pseudomonas sp. NPDC086581 TaxID=3364432 RepID=UPI003815E6E2